MNIFYKFLSILCIWFYVCGLYNVAFNDDYSVKQCIIGLAFPPYAFYVGAKENIMYFYGLKNNMKVCYIKSGREICE